MQGQLTLDLAPDRTDPATCPHGTYHASIDRTLCRKDGRKLWVECNRPHWGEPPTCADVLPDNSPEAVARRMEWMRRNE